MRHTCPTATVNMHVLRFWFAAPRTAVLVAALVPVVASCAPRRGLEPARPTTDAQAVGAPSPSGEPPSRADAARPVSRSSTERTPAIWRNDAVPGDELAQRALEAAGALALEEMLVERALRIELARRGIEVDAESIAQEESMARDGLSADPGRAEQLLQALRASQGLGARRWPSLLWRNAALRALARQQSSVGESEIATAHDLRHGARRAARIIVLDDLAAVQSAMDRLSSGEAFAEVAASMSTDSSSDRGGIVSPVARLDPTWPAPVREALWALDPGSNSAPVLIDGAYVIVRCESVIPADGVSLESSRAESERTARLAVDRVEMDRILREIVRGLDPTIFDRTLEESWQRTRNARRVP